MPELLTERDVIEREAVSEVLKHNLYLSAWVDGQRPDISVTVAALAAAPDVERVYRRLDYLGPLGCLVSGSGSSVFAVCRDRADAVRVADGFRAADRFEPAASQVYVVRSYWPSPR